MVSVASWVKKVGAGRRNFLDRMLQIFAVAAQNFDFARKFSQNGDFQPPDFLYIFGRKFSDKKKFLQTG